MAEAGYGTWKSPISSLLTTESGVDFMNLVVDGDPDFSDQVYWNEVRFNEQGRYVICSCDLEGKITEWTPKGFNARSLVHEYGGGDFCVYRGTVYFSNFSDQVLYSQARPQEDPQPVTDSSKTLRYSDGRFAAQKGKIYCVREDHEVLDSGNTEARNSIVAINPATKTQTVIHPAMTAMHNTVVRRFQRENTEDTRNKEPKKPKNCSPKTNVKENLHS